MKMPAACVAAAALLLAVCAPARGAQLQSLTLAWDPSPSSTVSGYALYYGASATNLDYYVDVGTNTSYLATGLQQGQTNYFAVVAYNAQGVESPFSNLITYVVPGLLSVASKAGPRSPAVISFPVTPGHTYKVQASVNLKTWAPIFQFSATNSQMVQFQDAESANLKMRFYRLVWQ